MVGITRDQLIPRLSSLATDPDAGLVALIVGGGGMGKTRVLDAVAHHVRERDLTVQLLSASPYGSSLDFDVATQCDLLLVDDAHFLNEESTAQLLRIAEDRERQCCLIVASRPVSDDPALGRLAEVAERRGVLCELDPYSETELGAALTTAIDAAVDNGLFQAVQSLACGHPLATDRLIAGWLEEGNIERGRLSSEPNACPGTVELALIGTIQQLESTDRVLLGAVAIASEKLKDTPPPELPLQTLQAHGLVLANGVMPPTIAKAVLRILEPTDLESSERHLATELVRLGADPVIIAERYLSVSDPAMEATNAWITAGDAVLDSDPAKAATWYRLAQRATPTTDTLARCAVAEAASGDEANANQAITEVLRAEPRNPRMLGAGAQIAATHGRWSEVADLLNGIEDHPRWSTGTIEMMVASARILADKHPSTDRSKIASDPTATVISSAVKALELSLQHIPDTSTLSEEVRNLASRAGNATQSPDLPFNAFELGAVAAVGAGEIDMAQLLLQAAQQTSSLNSLLGGTGSALHSWLLARTGGKAEASKSNDNCDLAKAPYAGILDLATEALHARRGGDVAASAAVLEQLRHVVTLAPIDVLTIDAAAELLILARRFGSRSVRHTIEERVESFLQHHGNPPLWVTRVRWAELEAAVGMRDLDLARQATNALKEVGPTSPRLSALIEASATWIEILEERCDFDVILSTASELEQSGFSNEAALLVGQAAIRIEPAEKARQLLNRARELRSGSGPQSGDQASPSGLSDREIEVGELILDGHSYKEIGSRLFISAKTVEHHAAHIRQKLDATGVPRAVFLAALRADLEH